MGIKLKITYLGVHVLIDSVFWVKGFCFLGESIIEKELLRKNMHEKELLRWRDIIMIYSNTRLHPNVVKNRVGRAC